MFVYIAAFILTAFFLRKAAYYYNLYKKTVRGGACLSHSSNCLLSSDKNEADNFQTLDKRYRLQYYLFFSLAFFPLFFVSAVRYGVGTDYFYTYVPNFYRILHGESPYSEWGFNELNRIIQIFTNDPQWLFVITSFIFVFILIKTIIKCSTNVTISIIVVLCSCIYFWSLNNIRQAIAVVFVFAAFPHLVRSHVFRYIIHIAIACLFHWSALIMIIPYCMINIKFIRKNFLFFAIVILAFIPILCQIIEVILSHTKYSYYFSDSFNTGDISIGDLLFNFLFLVLSFCILYSNRMESKYGYSLLFMQFLAFGTVIISIFLGIPELTSRIMMFFQVYHILLIPYCYKTIKKFNYKILFIFTYLFSYGAYMIYLIVFSGTHEVLPYHWIFGI